MRWTLSIEHWTQAEMRYYLADCELSLSYWDRAGVVAVDNWYPSAPWLRAHWLASHTSSSPGETWPASSRTRARCAHPLAHSLLLLLLLLLPACFILHPPSSSSVPVLVVASLGSSRTRIGYPVCSQPGSSCAPEIRDCKELKQVNTSGWTKNDNRILIQRNTI